MTVQAKSRYYFDSNDDSSCAMGLHDETDIDPSSNCSLLNTEGDDCDYNNDDCYDNNESCSMGLHDF